MLTNIIRKLTFSCLLVEVTFLGSSFLYLLSTKTSVLYTGRPRDVSIILEGKDRRCESEFCDGQKQVEKEEAAAFEKRRHTTSKTNAVSNSSMAMKGCPDGWPLEIIEVSENGNPTVQRCWKETGDGSWKCAEGWKKLDYSPFCVIENGEDQDNVTSDREIPPSVRHPEYAPISIDKKLLFIHVPKAGGRRIESSFLFEDERKRLDHHLGGNHKISSFDKNYFKDYHKFCMVRHPCSRLVSVWEGFSRGLGNHGDQMWVDSNLDEVSKRSFDAFIDLSLFPGGSIHVEDETHLQTQVGMLFDENGKFGLDQMLIFERWNESLDELERKIKVNVNSLKANHRATSRYKSCKEMYTSNTWDKLVKIYGFDFCVLGYSTKLEETDILPPLGLTPETLTQRFEKCGKDLASE